MRKIIAAALAFSVVFWNLENFFDFREGKQVKYRFYRKCNAVAKEIFRIGEMEGNLPFFIGFAEVENEFVVKSLLLSTALYRTPYRFIHYDSPDHRGIDCVLLYRRDSLKLLGSKSCHIRDSLGKILNTRDILLGSFLTANGRRVDVLINHHPSKIGGKEEPRMLAKRRMEELCDSLLAFGGTVVSIGDFNEGPGWKCRGMKDLGMELKGEGSIKFNGEWELIDRCYVNDGLNAAMRVVDDEILTVKDVRHGGQMPRRFMQGPRYLGGVSDHYPIVARIE